MQTPIYPWMRETKSSRAQYSSHTYQQASHWCEFFRWTLTPFHIQCIVEEEKANVVMGPITVTSFFYIYRVAGKILAPQGDSCRDAAICEQIY